MKNFFTYLLGWLLLASPALAQTTDPVRQKLDAVFANVDKSQVPTGYLYEAAVRFLRPGAYHSTLIDSSLTHILAKPLSWHLR